MRIEKLEDVKLEYLMVMPEDLLLSVLLLHPHVNS